MANNLGGNVTKFTRNLDKIIELESKTSFLNMNSALLGEFTGVGEIKVAKLSMDGLADYDRDNGFVAGGVSLDWETRRLEFDRGREFHIDVMDDEEHETLVSANVMGEFTRTKVIPEMDAIRFARLAENAGHAATEAFSSPDAALASVLLFEEYIQDMGKSLSDVTLCLTGTMKTLLRKAQPWRIGQGEDPNGNFATFDEMRLNVVPPSRFMTAIDLMDGTSTGEATGGYKRAEGEYGKTEDTDIVPGKAYFTKSGTTYTEVTSPAKASIGDYYELVGAGKAINFMGLTSDAAEAIQKHQKLRYFSPDTYQGGDMHCWQYRVFHDLIVLDNKKSLIYCSHAA